MKPMNVNVKKRRNAKRVGDIWVGAGAVEPRRRLQELSERSEQMEARTRQIFSMRSVWVWICVCSLCLSDVSSLWAANEQLRLIVQDKATGEPIFCRLHLKNANGKPRPYRGGRLAWADHVTVPGEIVLMLPVGEYSFVLEHGPEYKTTSGTITMVQGGNDTQTVQLERAVDIAADGWYAGDVDIQRSLRDIPPLLEAEDLYAAAVVSFSNEKLSEPVGKVPSDQPVVSSRGTRFAGIYSGRFVRSGAELLLANLPKTSISLTGAENDFPTYATILSQMSGLSQMSAANDVTTGVVNGGAANGGHLLVEGGGYGTAMDDGRGDGALDEGTFGLTPRPWVDLARMTSWDMPMLVANGYVDSARIIDSRYTRTKLVDEENRCKPRDKTLYPDALGLARWNLDVYERLLEAGVTLPLTAGSGSGDSPNAPGENRVYVAVDGAFSYAAWWENLRRGRSIVTNGPLMVASVAGEAPGAVFETGGRAEAFPIALTMSLRNQERVDYLQIIKNGQVYREISFSEYAESARLPDVEFAMDEEGWFLIRAVISGPVSQFRFAMTSPWFVCKDASQVTVPEEVDSGAKSLVLTPRTNRVSRASSQFFLDWTIERAKQIQKHADPVERKALLEEYRTARDFWKSRVETATCE